MVFEPPNKVGCLGCIGDEILTSYMVIMINHYKDPYSSTSIMESNKGFLRGSFGPKMVLNQMSFGLIYPDLVVVLWYFAWSSRFFVGKMKAHVDE